MAEITWSDHLGALLEALLGDLWAISEAYSALWQLSGLSWELSGLSWELSGHTLGSLWRLGWPWGGHGVIWARKCPKAL